MIPNSTSKMEPGFRFFANWHNISISHNRPCKWGLFATWKEIAFDIGTPKVKFHRGDGMESQFTIHARIWPFRVIAFWHNNRILWWGDWKCKRECKKFDLFLRSIRVQK
jgi:hypothetical protein